MVEQLPVWRPRALARRSFDSGNTGTGSPRSIGGLALSILADTTSSALQLAADRRAQQIAAQDAAAGEAAGRVAARTGAPLPTADNDFSVGAAAYEHAANAGYQAGLSNRVREAAAAAAAKAGDDPAAFDQALSKALPDAAQVPRALQPAFQDEVADVANRWRAGIAERQAKARREADEAEQRVAMASRQAEAAQAARAGDPDALIKANQEFEALGRSMLLSGSMTGQQLADARISAIREQREQHVWGMFERATAKDGIAGARAVQLAFLHGSADLGLPPDQADRMLAAMNRQLADHAALDEKAIRLAEKERKRQADDAVRQVVDLQQAGKLTPGTLAPLRDVLDPTDYRMAADRIRDESDRAAKPRLDQQLYVDLRGRAGTDDAVPAEAGRALIAGRLDRDAYEKIISEVDQARDAVVREARQYLVRRIQGSELNPLPGSNERAARALDTLQGLIAERAASGKPMRRDEVMDFARYIGDGDAQQSWRTRAFKASWPRYAPPGQPLWEIDLPAAAARTAEAFQRGEIDETKYALERAALAEADEIQQAKREADQSRPPAAPGAAR